MNRKIKAFLGIIVFAGLASIFLFNALNSRELIALSGKTMGTTYHIKYIRSTDTQLSSEEIYNQIERILKDVNQKMSTYVPTSELSLFNKNTQINKPIEISEDLSKVITEAIRLNIITNGALDITVGPLVNLWGFGPEKRIVKAPTEEQIRVRRAWIGIDKLILAKIDNKNYLQKKVPELYIDLSSIAKGFGVDQLATYLESLGLNDYLVEVGGEIRAKGRNQENKLWQIAIEKPTFDGSRDIETVIGLDNFAMATSGDYRNYFEDNGQRFSHEIDPFTGKPIQHHLASITVLSPSSMTADGLSTGLFVLGEDKALQVAEQNNLAIYLIIKTDKGFETKMSSAFKKLIKVN